MTSRIMARRTLEADESQGALERVSRVAVKILQGLDACVPGDRTDREACRHDERSMDSHLVRNVPLFLLLQTAFPHKVFSAALRHFRAIRGSHVRTRG